MPPDPLCMHRLDPRICPECGWETGWVIEHGASEPCAPRYWAGKNWGGLSEWTRDHLLAIRFAREIDARRVAEAMDDGVPSNFRICEHAWDVRKRDTTDEQMAPQSPIGGDNGG
jgi:hypothetical protein